MDLQTSFDGFYHKGPSGRRSRLQAHANTGFSSLDEEEDKAVADRKADALPGESVGTLDSEKRKETEKHLIETDSMLTNAQHEQRMHNKELEDELKPTPQGKAILDEKSPEDNPLNGASEEEIARKDRISDENMIEALHKEREAVTRKWILLKKLERGDKSTEMKELKNKMIEHANGIKENGPPKCPTCPEVPPEDPKRWKTDTVTYVVDKPGQGFRMKLAPVVLDPPPPKPKPKAEEMVENPFKDKLKDICGYDIDEDKEGKEELEQTPCGGKTAAEAGENAEPEEANSGSGDVQVSMIMQPYSGPVLSRAPQKPPDEAPDEEDELPEPEQGAILFPFPEAALSAAAFTSAARQMNAHYTRRRWHIRNACFL